MQTIDVLFVTMPNHFTLIIDRTNIQEKKKNTWKTLFAYVIVATINFIFNYQNHQKKY